MAESWGDGGRQMVGDRDGYSARSGDFTDACQYLSALRLRPLGGGVAQEVRTRRHDRRPIRRRSCLRLSAPNRSRPFFEGFPVTAGEGWAGARPGVNPPHRVPVVVVTTAGEVVGRVAGPLRH